MWAYRAVLKGRLEEVSLVKSRLRIVVFFLLEITFTCRACVHVAVREEPVRVGSLLSLSVFWGWNAGLLTWQQAPLLRNSLSGPALEP